MFMTVDFKEVAWRARALKARGFKRDRLYNGYIKYLRYQEFRTQAVITSGQLRGCYRDHEDFLDFVEYSEKRAIDSLADYISQKAFEHGGYFDDE